MARDANRIWQVASYLSKPQFKDRQSVPPSDATQAQLRKLSIVAHLSQTLRAFGVEIGEQAWEKRVLVWMTLAHDNYLRPMQNNLGKSFPARYAVRADESWNTQERVSPQLTGIGTIPKNLVQPTRFCDMVDSTIKCDLPYDNVVPDVMVVTMLLS